MPDKLKDCSAKNREERELFIVEGDSAGGSAIKARDPRTQAILPIRGKILNVERARIDKMLKNLEIQALISAIGAGVGEEFDVEKSRYDKVIVLRRRRRRRQPHPHAAADVLLPADEGRSSSSATCTSPSRRSTRPRWARRRSISRTTTPRTSSCARTPTTRRTSPASRAWARWTPRSCGSRRWSPDCARCCRSAWSRPLWPTRSCRSSWATTSSRRKQFIVTNAKDVRFLDI